VTAASDYAAQRRRMVDGQLIPRSIRDPRVLDAFRSVPRERFVPPNRLGEAYGDHPVSIGCGQTVSQPYIVALTLQALKLTGGERVLEIGTGSGYQTALLAKLAREVFTVERIEELSLRAQQTLSELGCENARFLVGDGTLGWVEHAPYDAIAVSAGAPETPPSLLSQLRVGGRMVIPVGDRFAQKLLLVKKREDGSALSENLCHCVFVQLIGWEGWHADDA